MPAPVRVLQVVTVMNRGGLETMLMNYYRHVDRSKVQFDFMVHRPERGVYDDEIEELGGKIYRMPPIHPRCFLRYHRELDQFFTSHREYRVVHSHLDVLSTLVLHAAKGHGVPTRIAHSHNTSFADRGLRKVFKLWSRAHLTAQCTHLFACSRAAGVFQYGRARVKSGKVAVINNAIDTRNFAFRQETRDRLRRRMQLENGPVIGHVGRFTLQKNHKLLLEIFAELLKRRPAAHLLLVGDGELRPRVEAQALQLGIEDQIIFTGLRSDVNELMAAMDLFLLPSLFEGFPVVAIEAQATGLPLLCSDSITNEVALTPQVRFLPLSAPASAWAREALDLLKNGASLRRENSAQSVAEQGYDIEDCARRLQNFYFQCCREN